MFNKPVIIESLVPSTDNIQESMDLGKEDLEDLYEFPHTPFLQLVEENLDQRYVIQHIPCFSFGCGIEWKELG
jgi:hypothetical protein